MPQPSDARPVRITSYAGGVADVEGVGPVPTLGGYPVTAGGTALLIRSTSGALFVVPVAAVGSGPVVYTWGGATVGADPGAGNLNIAGTGTNPRTFAVSATDADGYDRNLGPLQPGDTVVLTDDPATPPVSGFARYTLTSDPVDEGGWWSFTALRGDTDGSQNPPPLGTRLRFYSHLVGGGGGGSTGDYVERTGDTMTGGLVMDVPGLSTDALSVLRPGGGFALRVTSGGAVSVHSSLRAFAVDLGPNPTTADPLWTVNAQIAGRLFLGPIVTGVGITIDSAGVPYRRVVGSPNEHRLLDTRDGGWVGFASATMSNVSSVLVPNAITFPPGLFTASPVCVASIDSAAGSASSLLVRTYNRSPTNCGLIVNSGNGSLITGTFAVAVHARAAT